MRPLLPLKKHVKHLCGRFPLYKIMPAGKYRDYAAIEHIAETQDPVQLVEFVKELPAGSRQFAGSAIKSLEVLLKTGNDQLFEESIVYLLHRFPELPQFRILESEYLLFRNQVDGAFERASKAFFLDPSSSQAAAQYLQTAYSCQGIPAAHALAVKVVEKFPFSSAPMWVAAKHCDSEDQLARILSAWSRRAKAPRHLSKMVRPLANAAVRANRIDIANNLYVKAISYDLSSNTKAPEVKSKTLAGKGGSSALADVKDVLSSIRTEYFLAAGTALGIVREGKPLDHDSDIDIGIMDASWDKEELESAFQKHPRFILSRTHPDNPKVGVTHRGGASIDLFRFYEENGQMWHNGVFVRWHNTPFTLKESGFPEIPANLPGDVDKYLTECYGDWRVPDPSFDAFIDAPNLEVLWPAYHEHHRLRRAFRYVRSGAISGAMLEFEAVKSLLSGSTEGRRLLAMAESMLCGAKRAG